VGSRLDEDIEVRARREPVSLWTGGEPQHVRETYTGIMTPDRPPGRRSRALTGHPRLREQLASGEVGWEDIVEETLRADSPVAHLPFRFATEEFELGGVTIAKGDAMLIDYAGIGRDPAVHGESADVFDATRSDKTHLTLGHGVHYCLGVRLAKLAKACSRSGWRFPRPHWTTCAGASVT